MSWLAHVQLLDSAFPIGAFSHSFGLETLIQEGRVTTPHELGEYVETMLQCAWAPCDALGVKAAYCYLPINQDRELWAFDNALHLSWSARETREGQRKIGRRLLETVSAVHPHLPWPSLREAVERNITPGTYPVVYGWACYHLGIDLQAAATGLLYANVNHCLGNATRAMRLGQTQAQTLLAQMLPKIETAWQSVRERDSWDFSTGVPMADTAMQRHETLYSRLFMS